MPRLARLPSIPFGWYYVVLRSVSGRRIVRSTADLDMLFTVLRSTLRESGVRLHGAYISEREMHLAIEVGRRPVNAFTGNLQREYAQLVNQTYDERGSLFRMHYHRLLFQHSHWLVPLVHYIHWIPRAERGSEDRAGLWWSSDAIYRRRTKQSWITTHVVLRILTGDTYGGKIRESADDDGAYLQRFDRMPNPAHGNLFRHGSEEDPRILGDREFITQVWRLTGRRSRGAKPTRRPAEDIAAVVTTIIARFNALADRRLPRHPGAWCFVTPDNLRSRSRARPLPMARALIAGYLIEGGIATCSEAGRFLGCGPVPISARRRRYYRERFLGLFGMGPELLLIGAQAVDQDDVLDK